jgi:hypothetical protein
MNNTSKETEIELGNGYGYFCDISDIENQRPILKLEVKPKRVIRYKKTKQNQDHIESDHKNYILCSCFVVITVIAIYLCLL